MACARSTTATKVTGSEGMAGGARATAEVTIRAKAAVYGVGTKCSGLCERPPTSRVKTEISITPDNLT